MLTFTTASGASSEFVKVRVIRITAKLADGSQITKDVDYVTRIAVIGEQSLLALQPKADGSKSLMLFGKPAKTYAIEHSINGASGPWTRLSTTIPLDGTSAKVENLPQTGTVGFYRAVELQ
jgi:hypothetical protein